jgi:hypothetical protein
MSASCAFNRQAAGAFFSYIALSLMFFGRGLVPHFSSYHIGAGPDPAQSIWFLAWWAHAITHRLNPLSSDVLFVPGGANLAWATDVPVAALLATPFTLAMGPVAAYNALMLLAPALAGWAGFVLCRYLARSWRAGWLGGFIFGFSPYVVGGMLGHLDLLLVFPIPLMVWLVLRRLGGEISAPRLVSAMVLLLLVQLGCFVEIFATTAAFGALTLALALLFTEVEERRRLWALISPIAASYAITAIIASPLLYLMFIHGYHNKLIFSPWLFSADLIGLVIPTPMNELGRLQFFAELTKTFRSGFGESGTYIALPLLIIAVLHARSYWRTAHGRLISDLLAIGCVLSLGPWLEIAGRITIGLPWLILEQLPLLGKALPARFAVYTFLILAVMTSMWISATNRGRWRWILGAIVIPFMLPTLTASYWVQPLDLPPFFSSGAYRDYLAPGEAVLILPFGAQGDDMLWQASTGMYFKLAGGFLGYAPLLPEEYARWPIAPGLYNVAGVPEPGEQMKAFLASHLVGAVIVSKRRYRGTHFYAGRPNPIMIVSTPLGPRERNEIDRCLSALGIPPLEIGGVSLYRIPQPLKSDSRPSALDMQQRAASARFRALLLGAQNYLAQGGDLARLTPQALQSLGLVPLDWFGGEPFPVESGNPVFHTASILGPSPGGAVAIGIESSYAALKPIIKRYGPWAAAVYFPYPAPVARLASDDGRMGTMVMEFDRDGLARAAQAASASSVSIH